METPVAEPEPGGDRREGLTTGADQIQEGDRLEARPPLPSNIGEIQLAPEDLEDFEQLSGTALDRAIDEAEGVALIGLKTAAATRTRETGVVPAVTREDLLAAHGRIEAVGGRITRTFLSLPIAVASLPSGAASALLDFDEINYVEPNGRGELAGTVRRVPAGGVGAPVSGQDTTWGADIIRAPIAWAGNHKGHDATITFLDTGVDSIHVASGDGPVRLTTCMLVDPTFDSCYDDVPHGSHIAGVAAGRDNTEGTLGVMHYEGAPHQHWPA